MRILLIEDDTELAGIVAGRLEKEGYRIDICSDGRSALHYALNPDYAYDLFILDRMLPGLDGLSVCRQIRERNISSPVLMVTAMSEIDDRVDGLDCGADDYLTKPFAVKELLARVRALLRRQGAAAGSSLISFSDLNFFPGTRELSCGSASLTLSGRESSLLCAFLSRPLEAMSREQLIFSVWGTDADVEPGNVDNYVSFLRRRLRELNSRVSIKTIYGSGFLLTDK
ncbi:response regulator transcription factor [Qiania dongpingensis]|uniref:Stage 0 sporulation protein A homolog n=1 Tax=Qiania dongpingensis TaxID=2763669 RepID=A0A7G9G1U9_9FIRM|nr:response regulator transcription factor [Qiania dongpingensis]QNM04781.1 response regulator transcription factor [Qiania dongpingensis]